MARIRKGNAYRKIERPYTRKSKYKAHNFVRAQPSSKIIRYVMGNCKKKFDTTVNLITTESIQLRHNSIESARQTCNRFLEENFGKDGYHYVIRMYPHHILRENPLAAGAGADRMSTGMKHSFGKSISIAAQVFAGKTIMCVDVPESGIVKARRALKKASYKMACRTKIEVVKHNEEKK